MRKSIMVTINGDILLFNNNLSEQECASLQDLANSAPFKESFNLENAANFQSQFVDAVKRDLGISLEPIKISYVVRIQ